MQLSKLESKTYETLKKNNLDVFRVKDIVLLLKINKIKAYNLIKAMKRKTAIETIQKGVFTLKGTDELAAGSSLNWPSYLSFWSALSYYGFTDQTPKTMFFASTRYKRQVKNYKYVTIAKKRFFGYTKIGDITIAEKEKAIIDSLLFPKYVGGIKEVSDCIKKSLTELDMNKFINYALQIESKAVLRRLGFILEKSGYKEKLLKKIQNKIGKGYELLDPSLKKKGNLNKKWLLDVNHDI